MYFPFDCLFFFLKKKNFFNKFLIYYTFDLVIYVFLFFCINENLFYLQNNQDISSFSFSFIYLFLWEANSGMLER